MKKNNTPLVLVGVGALALLAMGSRSQGDGSESGGIQIPFLSPQSAGTDPSGGSPVYNISFPEFAGFPTATGVSTTKKEWNPAWGATPSWADPSSNVYNPVRAERGLGILEASGGKPVPIAGLGSLKKQPVTASKLTPYIQNFGDTNQKSSFSDYLKNTNIYGQPVTKKSSVGSQNLASPLINTGLVKSGQASSGQRAPTKKSSSSSSHRIVSGGSKTPFTRVIRRR